MVMNSKLKIFLKKTILLLVFSLIYFVIGYLAALLISKQFNYSLQTVMSYEGIALIIIGILTSMKGNPSGVDFSGIGQNNENGISFSNLETTRLERENNPYYKDYFKNNIVQFVFGNLAILIGGILIIAFCIFIL